MEHSPRGRKREHSKVCIQQVALSAGNPITNGGLYRVSRTQPFIVILHRNLAFFQTLCEAVR